MGQIVLTKKKSFITGIVLIYGVSNPIKITIPINLPAYIHTVSKVLFSLEPLPARHPYQK